MKLLLLADKESRYLWDFYKPGCLREYDLMLSCGDLKAEYLTFLATLGRSPLLYVRGNHDDNYESRPPEGCECIEDKLVTVGGFGRDRREHAAKACPAQKKMKAFLHASKSKLYLHFMHQRAGLLSFQDFDFTHEFRHYMLCFL